MSIESFLFSHNLSMVGRLSKGYSSEIFLVKNLFGKTLVLKVEKEKSSRIEMARKEVDFLKMANAVGIGPILFDFDLDDNCILMEFVEGKRFCDWADTVDSRHVVEVFLKDLFSQLKKLDEIGLDHGQLGGSARNILVRAVSNKPVVIDFEKASIVRKPHNLSQFLGEFFYNERSRIGEHFRILLGGEKETELFLKKNALV